MTVSPSEIVHSFEHFLRILGDVMAVEELAPLSFALLWGAVACTVAFTVGFVCAAFRVASACVRAGVECWLQPRVRKESDERKKE